MLVWCVYVCGRGHLKKCSTSILSTFKKKVLLFFSFFVSLIPVLIVLQICDLIELLNACIFWMV